MEDCNQPSPERIDLLRRLEEQMGSVTPHFWAACQICDLGALEKLLHQPVAAVQAINNQTSRMVRHCKLDSLVPLLYKS